MSPPRTCFQRTQTVLHASCLLLLTEELAEAATILTGRQAHFRSTHFPFLSIYILYYRPPGKCWWYRNQHGTGILSPWDPVHVRSQLHSRGECPGSSESAQSRGCLCCASRNKVGELMETSASCGAWYLVGTQSVFIKWMREPGWKGSRCNFLKHVCEQLSLGSSSKDHSHN